eukprot:gene19213-64985_t
MYADGLDTFFERTGIDALRHSVPDVATGFVLSILGLRPLGMHVHSLQPGGAQYNDNAPNVREWMLWHY